MRIGNPPPFNNSTIVVSAVQSPSVFTTLQTIQLTTGTSTDIAPIANQQELILSNISATGAVYARDTAASTANLGTLLSPGGTAALSVNATVRLTNNSGSTVLITGNQTGVP